MNPRLLAPLLAALFSLLAPRLLVAHSISTSDREDARIDSCDSLRMRIDNGPTARGEDVVEVSLKDAPELEVEAAENGGVRLQGWDGPGWRLRACKAVAEEDSAWLSRISLQRDGSRVTVKGPNEEGWFVHVIVDVPKGAQVSARAENGPISIIEVSGKTRVDTINGPVSVVRTRGTLKVEATNGPISIVDSSGDIHVDAENGPLSVKLGEGGWSGAGLEAHTDNGPLSLKMPARYDSGVEVSMSSHAPFHCAAGTCDGARKDWEGGTHTLAFGGGAVAVKLSTVNGPVSIKPRT
jgi:hypothetical protein